MLWRNLHYTFRAIARNPGITLVALISLALGVGGNTAIFSVVNAFLLRPLPFAEPDRLVAVYAVPPDFDRGPASYPEFLVWRDQNRTFSSLTGVYEASFNWTGSSEPLKIQGALVTEGYFETFGTRPLVGRTFLPSEHRDDGHVVVVSENFWRQQLGGRRDIIGKALTLDGHTYTVIGVMHGSAPDFTTDHTTNLWIPFEPNHPMFAMNPANHFLRVFGRIKAGLTPEQAQDGMPFLAKQVVRQYPFLSDVIFLTPVRDALIGQLRRGLIFLLGSVFFLLLIACANIANLQMIRAATLRRELAVRSSLGATRGHLMGQMLTESLVINLIGGALGLLCALVSQHWLLRLWPASIPLPYGLGIDWRVLGFTAFVSLVTGLLFGLGPAAIGSRAPPLELLSHGSPQTGFGTRQNRFCDVVVILEFALTMLLMVGAGLMVKSFNRLRHVDPGFEPQGMVTAEIALPEYEFRQGTAAFRSIMEQIQALPGVRAVGATSLLPLGAKKDLLAIRIEGQSFRLGQPPVASMQVVSPAFFDAMHTPLLSGRLFTDRDTRDAPHVVLVNQNFARRFWPNDSAVGKHLDNGLFGNAGWQEVVGVVGDTRAEGLGKADTLQIYLPYTEFSNIDLTLMVRADFAASSLEPAIQKVVWRVHPGLPIRFRTMADVLQDSVSQQRTVAILPSFFAVCGLILSCIGVYAITSYAIGRRTREIGIRMALGAGFWEVRLLIFRRGLLLTVLGAVVGIIGALILTRLISGWLYGISPFDPQIFLASGGVLAVVATVAIYLPTRRATRVNPMVALRED